MISKPSVNAFITNNERIVRRYNTLAVKRHNRATTRKASSKNNRRRVYSRVTMRPITQRQVRMKKKKIPDKTYIEIDLAVMTSRPVAFSPTLNCTVRLKWILHEQYSFRFPALNSLSYRNSRARNLVYQLYHVWPNGNLHQSKQKGGREEKSYWCMSLHRDF